MKTRSLFIMLCFSAVSAFAQSDGQQTDLKNTGCKEFPNMPARAVAVFPKTAYTPLEDPSCPPCYEYRSKYGYKVMECPFLRFPPEHGNKEEPISGAVTVPASDNSIGMTDNNNTINLESQRSFTGNYPAVCKRDPEMPARAVPVFPKSAYTPLEDPSCAPCYEYRSKYGYKVMECPFLRFPPEHRQ